MENFSIHLPYPMILPGGFGQSGATPVASSSIIQQRTEKDLRQAYWAYGRGDLRAILRVLDPDVEWVEPEATYRGVEAVLEYLWQWRSIWAEGNIDLECFISIGDKVVVLANAHVREKGSKLWAEVRLADVYTFRNGRVTHLKALGTDHETALRWPVRAQTELWRFRSLEAQYNSVRI